MSWRSKRYSSHYSVTHGLSGIVETQTGPVGQGQALAEEKMLSVARRGCHDRQAGKAV